MFTIVNLLTVACVTRIDEGGSVRLGIFVDGSNMLYAQSHNEWNVDWRKVLEYHEEEGEVTEAHYFSAAPHFKEIAKIEKYRAFKRMLAINGYTIHDKETKVLRNHQTGEEKKKGNLDLELALTAFELVDNYDRCILYAGDGDYTILAEKLRQRGRQIYCVCRKQMTATELINAANRYVNLMTLRDKIEK